MIRFRTKPSNPGGCLTMLIGAVVAGYFSWQGSAGGARAAIDAGHRVPADGVVMAPGHPLFDVFVVALGVVSLVFLAGAVLELVGVGIAVRGGSEEIAVR